ncbi:acyl-CoA-binding protein homolog [Achroia grisella]|uniref:acyl-CoA-binding protein homolog n=1 Tax=Achroia grisella TaxID=688607 RepID=UPI0027D2A7BC|nr:acyl-CoA-binding protein homolog [Achroia grisella]
MSFEKAAADVKNLKALPGDKDLLELYGLYKQGTVGDADPSNKPGLLDLKGKAKFEAWSSRKGTSQADAQAAYIAKVQSLIDTIGLN